MPSLRTRPDSAAVQDALLVLSDERDRQLALRLQAEREGYERGHRDGYRAGYERGRADADAEWMASLAPAREAARRLAQEPSRAELETLRWGRGGRAAFSAPRPGDYPGQGGEAA